MILLISISLEPAVGEASDSGSRLAQLTARLAIRRRFATAKCSRRARDCGMPTLDAAVRCRDHIPVQPQALIARSALSVSLTPREDIYL
jgi:hypothetical protein